MLANLLQSSTMRDISIHHIMSVIRSLATQFDWCQIIKVHRDDVSLAHDLAKRCRSSPFPFVFLGFIFIACMFSRCQKKKKRVYYMC